MTNSARSAQMPFFVRWGAVIYVSLLILTAFLSHFGVLSNDCFPLRWQAEHLSFGEPSSFYDGFFPIGYPLLLRVVLWVAANPYPALIALQCLLGYFLFKWTFHLCRSYMSATASTLATLLICFYPFMLRSVLSPVPDYLLVLAAVFAMSRIAHNGNWLIAGVALGIGFLFRTHAAVIVLSISLAALVVPTEWRWNRIARLWLGFLPFFLFQGLIQLWSGHGFFENSQAYNVWRTIHGSDWANPPQNFHMGILDVIREDTSAFLSSYVNVLFSQLAFVIAFVAVLIYRSWRPKVRQTLTFLAWAGLFYIFFSSVGGSARGALPIVAIAGACVFYLLSEAFSPLASNIFVRRVASVWLPGVICLIGLVGLIFSAQKTADRIDSYNAVQRRLLIEKESQLPHVFTDDFDLYFPALAGAVPRTSGGWAELGLPKYSAEYPHMADSISAVFYTAAAREGIQWVVLRNPPYDGRLSQAVRSDTLQFKPLGNTARHSLFALR